MTYGIARAGGVDVDGGVGVVCNGFVTAFVDSCVTIEVLRPVTLVVAWVALCVDTESAESVANLVTRGGGGGHRGRGRSDHYINVL